MTTIKFSDDPIFAVIERHRRLSALYDSAVSRSANLADDHPDYEAAQAVTDERCQALLDHAAALVRSAPATIEGAVALARYVAGLQEWETPSDPSDRWEGSWHQVFLNSLADALDKITAS